jgi:hypothetical protein
MHDPRLSAATTHLRQIERQAAARRRLRRHRGEAEMERRAGLHAAVSIAALWLATLAVAALALPGFAA